MSITESMTLVLANLKAEAAVERSEARKAILADRIKVVRLILAKRL